jgi:hypothetical protein
MKIFHALREGLRGFRHGYQSGKEERLSVESQMDARPSQSFIGALRDFREGTYAVVAVLIMWVIAAVVVLVLFAVIKWAYLEVFHR